MSSVRVGVIGAGLMGGSVCKSLRECGLATCRVYSPSASTAAEASAAGFPVEESVVSLVENSDVVFVCVPLTAQMAVFGEVAHAVKTTGRRDIVVTDVSSVKGAEARSAEALLTDVGAAFVAGHPMAGTEKSGFAASTPDMFDGATWVLCPQGAAPRDVLRVMELILAMKARVSILDIESHDRGVAAISHLPYVLAASLMAVIPGGDDRSLAFRLAAGSFRDATRVAASEPWLSSSMVNFNSHHVGGLVEEVRKVLADLSSALRDGDAAEVLSFFEQAQDMRSQYAAVKSSPNAERVSWRADNALDAALGACRAGALIRSVTVSSEDWDVLLER